MSLRFLRYCLLLAAILAATLACSLFSTGSEPTPTSPPPILEVEPSPVSLPTATIPPSATAVPPTPVPTATQTEIAGGGQVEVLEYTYSEDFSALPDNWDIDEIEDEVAAVRFSLADGAYIWDATAKQDMAWLQLADPAVPLPEQDYYLTVSLTMYSGGPELAAGVLFNCQDIDNLYFARLSSGGTLGVYALVDNAWQELVAPQSSQHFRPGETNRLIVLRQGDQFEIQINDYPAAEISDFTFSAGTIGLAIELDTGETGKFSFDDLRIMEPGEGAARVEEPDPAPGPTMLPMGASYTLFEGQAAGLNYTLEHPYPFTHSTSGGWEQFCLQAPEKACVSLQAHPDFSGDAAALADEVIAGFSSAVNDYSELHRQSTQTAQAYPAVWVGYTYNTRGQDLEGSRLFVVVDGVGFDLAAEAEPVMMELYRPVLTAILESFQIVK